MDRLQGRYVDDVREHVTDSLDTWIEWADNEGDIDKDDIATASSIAHDLCAGHMLEKEQAKWLKAWINDQVSTAVANKGVDRVGALEIDELSIWADAWGLYCKPGTYSVSIY